MDRVKGEPLLYGEALQDAIIKYFEDYITKSGYSTEGAERHKIPTAFYRAIFRHIYRDIFRKNNVNTLDIPTLETITETYISLCNDYSIASMMCFYADYIGVDTETIKRWCEGDTRTAIYRDDTTGEILTSHNNMRFYRDTHPQAKIVEYVSVGFCELAKKIKQLRQDIVISKSLDFQNGILMDLNNGRETGTEYNQKRAIETASAHAVLGMADLPQLNCSDI